MRLSTSIFALAFLSSPALSAEHIACASFDGLQQADLYVTFNEGRYSGRIERVDIPTEYVMLTTEPDADGNSGLLIALPEVKFDRISVSLENPRNVHIIADLQLSRAVAYMHPDDPENDQHVAVVGGTLSLQGTGVWVVTCTGWE